MSLPISDPILLVGGAIIIAWLSRKTLRKRGSHGYYRFFAAELLLGLVVLNRHQVGDQTIANGFLYTSAALLIYPEKYSDIIGAVLFFSLFLYQRKRRKGSLTQERAKA